jgi:hypothetical protein
MYRNAVATDNDVRQDEAELITGVETDSVSTRADQDDLTRSFVRLSNLASYPLDRLSRYEATLWRQACQILFTLQCLDRRKPWEKLRVR